jgi:hypothetical protein
MAVELAGGVANTGRVYRVGGLVYRPAAPAWPATHAFLGHLAGVGFTGSPRVVNTCGDIEILSWVPGRAARAPLPDWALTETALLSAAGLLRRFHDASAGFAPDEWEWPVPRVPRQYRTHLIAHNDVHPGNLIFVDERATGLIDFDLAGPSSAVWDLATLARAWAPTLADEDAPHSEAARLDRFTAILDAYGLPAADRTEVAEALLPNHDWTYQLVRTAARSGHSGFREYWRAVSPRIERARNWLIAHHADLRAAAC